MPEHPPALGSACLTCPADCRTDTRSGTVAGSTRSVSFYSLQGVVVSSITSHPRGQVCCVPAASLSSYLSQRSLLEHSTFRQPGPVAGARCGRQLTAAKRVVGGTEAGFGSFPWMALVRAGQARCGGALIGDRWVSK